MELSIGTSNLTGELRKAKKAELDTKKTEFKKLTTYEMEIEEKVSRKIKF
jgi:hypothetical protein